MLMLGLAPELVRPVVAKYDRAKLQGIVAGFANEGLKDFDYGEAPVLVARASYQISERPAFAVPHEAGAS